MESSKTNGTSLLTSVARQSKELYECFTEEMLEDSISGKTLEEWRKHFFITVPPDLNPATCISMSMEIMELHQEASFLKAAAERAVHDLKRGGTSQYRHEFSKLVGIYKSTNQKLPAKDTLATLAEKEVGDFRDAQSHAEADLAFWKEVLNHLGLCRKITEHAIMAIGIEAKALQSERFVHSTNDRLVHKGTSYGENY
jgi:hypothetical protein